MTTIAETLAVAKQHHVAGDLQRAEAIYRQILELDPVHADALHFLGLIAHQVGRHDLAVDYIQRSIVLLPLKEGFHCNLGMAYQALGRLDQAAASYGEAIRLRPNYAEVHYSLASVHKAQGKWEDAAASYRQALLLKPDFPQAHNNLGNVYLELGKLEQAVNHFQQALRLDPHHVAAHNNLGIALKKLGKLDEAAVSFQQSLELRPNYAEAHNNLAGVYQQQGDFERALASYRQALRLQPGLAPAHLNLGTMLLTRGDQLQIQGLLDEAIACYRQALVVLPDCVEAHNNLGNTLGIRGKWKEAAGCYRQALRFKPDCAEAHFNLGSAFAMSRNVAEAAACFHEALRLQPEMADANMALGMLLSDQEGNAEEAIAYLEKALRQQPTDRLRIALATRLPAIYQSMAELELWRNRLIQEVGRLRDQKVVLDLTNEPAPHVFYLVYQGFNDRDILHEIAQLMQAPSPTLPPLPAAAGRKIRVGLISSFFKGHTIGQWMQGLVAKLARDDFELIVLSLGSHQDDIAGFIRRHADRYVEVPSHLPSARRLIAGEQLDILLYADIGMDSVTYSLAFSRLAPIQCVTLGHPVTTGIDTIDYYISTEDLETPEADQQYTEKLIRLKSLPIYFYKPLLPSPLEERSRFGLSKEDHIYACLQSPFKFHPAFDEILGGILRGDRRGKLVLTQGLAPHWEQLLRERFARTLPDMLDRIRFFPMLGYRDYINLVALADVQLDPTPFGSGSTSYDAFAAGVPVVTMPGRLLRGRITLALYKQMQILDCVAGSPREYIDIALRLGTDRAYRERISRKILDANAVLFENSAGIRELERFFRQAVAAGHGREKANTDGSR